MHPWAGVIALASVNVSIGNHMDSAPACCSPAGFGACCVFLRSASATTIASHAQDGRQGTLTAAAYVRRRLARMRQACIQIMLENKIFLLFQN
jgi:hypothetical protein